MGVEKDAFLYCGMLDHCSMQIVWGHIHLLKLVTGVDTSTRPERRSGRAGKTAGSARRTAAAAPKRSNFWLTDMANPILSWHQSHDGRNGFVELRVRVEHQVDPCTLMPAEPRQKRRISNFFVPPKVRPAQHCSAPNTYNPKQWLDEAKRRVKLPLLLRDEYHANSPPQAPLVRPKTTSLVLAP